MDEPTNHETSGRASLNEAVARQQALLAQHVVELAAEESAVKHETAYFATHHPATIAQQDDYLAATGHYFSPSGL